MESEVRKIAAAYFDGVMFNLPSESYLGRLIRQRELIAEGTAKAVFESSVEGNPAAYKWFAPNLEERLANLWNLEGVALRRGFIDAVVACYRIYGH